jgi:hypothetical protein
MQAAIRSDDEHSSVLFALKMSMMEIFQRGWETPQQKSIWEAVSESTASKARHLGDAGLEDAEIQIFGPVDTPQNDRTDSTRTLLSVMHTEMREQYSRLDRKIEEHGQTMKEILDAIQSNRAALHPSSDQAERPPPSKDIRPLSSPNGFGDSTRLRRFEKYELAGAPPRRQGSTGRALARAQSGGRGDDDTTFDTFTESLRSEASLATKLRRLLGKKGGGEPAFEGARSPRRSSGRNSLQEDTLEWQPGSARRPHERPSNGARGLLGMRDVEAGVRASMAERPYSSRMARIGKENETGLPTSGVVRHWLGTRSTLR